MEHTEQKDSPVEFHSRQDKSAYVGIVFFSFILIGTIALPFLPGESSGKLTPLVVIAAVVCFFLLRLCFRAIQNMKTSYICGRSSIKQIRNQAETEFKWDEIIDLECANAAGGVGELRIKLTDREHRVMEIGTEYLPHGGRSLVALLQKHLASLFKDKSLEYLNGNKKWQFSVIKEMLKVEGNQLHIEYPARKKYLIPFQTLKRIEWLPGIISGTSPGYLIVEHEGGKIKLPQTIKGMQYFLFSMKNILNLNDIINPVRSREDLDEMRRLSIVAGRKILCMISGAVLTVAMLLSSIAIGWDMLKDYQTDTLGVPTPAVITAKEKDGNLQLKYCDPDGKNHQLKVKVTETYHSQVKTDDIIDILVHPAYKENIAFPGKFSPSKYFTIGLVVLCTLLAIIGVSLAIFGFWKFAHLRRTFQSLEAKFSVEKLPEINTRDPAQEQTEIKTQPSENENPPFSTGSISNEISALPPKTKPNTEPDQPTDGSNTPPLELIKCSQCKTTFSGNYYLSSGNTWCPACRGNSDNIKPKIGCLILVRSIAAGFCGAIVGGGLWATMVITTGYELGIIAIFVGLLTGYAVKLGSGAYRSRLLQFMAVLFTFLGLSYSTIPILISEFRKDPKLLNKFKQDFEIARQRTTENQISQSDIEAIENALKKEETLPNVVPPTVDTSIKQENIPETKELSRKTPEKTTETSSVKKSEHAPQAPQATTATESQKVKTPMTLTYEKPPDDSSPLIKIGKFLLFIVLGILIILFGPIVIYVIYLFSSPLSLLFTAIAFWEAWRLNRVEALEFQGPFNNEEQINFDKAEFTVDPK